MGESRYSAYTRWGSYRAGLRAQENRSALWEHAVTHHGRVRGEGKEWEEDFQMKVTGTHASSARRLITEGVQISEALRMKGEKKRNNEEMIVMNSRREWFQPKLVNVRASTLTDY